MSMPSSDSSYKRFLPSGLLVGVTLLVLGRVASHEFVWDDVYTLATNSRLNPPTLATVLHYFTHAEFGLYMPVTYLVWTTLAMLGSAYDAASQTYELNPYVFHTANLLIHCISVLLVFSIIKCLLRETAPVAAWVGAVVFAIHPLQVESVAWASGMKDLLCGMFVLAMVWFFIRDTQAIVTDRARKGVEDSPASSPAPRLSLAMLVLCTFAFVLALLSKPAAVYAPLLILAIAILFPRRPLRRVLPVIFFWLILAGCIALTARQIQPAIEIWQPPLWSRPILAGDAVAFYLRKLVVPWPLTIDYGRSPEHVFQQGTYAFTAIIPVLLFVVAWIFGKRFPTIFAGAVLFLIPLLPVLGFVPFLFQQYSTVADHYAYVSFLGVSVCVAGAIRHAKSGVVVGTFVVLFLGCLSYVQASTWRDEQTLFTHTLKVNPRSFMAAGNLGSFALRDGDMRAAETYLRGAIEIKSDYVLARELLIKTLHQQSRTSEAIAEGEQLLQICMNMPDAIRPDVFRLHVGLARQLLQAQRASEAIPHLESALQLQEDEEVRALLVETVRRH